MPIPIGIGITEALADGRYLQLTQPSGAGQVVNLNGSSASTTLSFQDSVGNTLLELKQNGVGNSGNTIVIGAQAVGVQGSTVIGPAGGPVGGGILTNLVKLQDALGNDSLIIGSGTAKKVQTANSTLDDGSGGIQAKTTVYATGNVAAGFNGSTWVAAINYSGGNFQAQAGSALSASSLILGAFSPQLTVISTDTNHFITLDANVSFGGLNFRSPVKAYQGVNTAGEGVAPTYAAGFLISLNTTSTAVCSYTPTSAIGQHFRITWTLSCVTGSTPTLQVTFTDPKAGAQTITLYNTAMLANTVQSGVYSLVATSGAAISVTGSDSAALGDIFATATIEELQ